MHVLCSRILYIEYTILTRRLQKVQTYTREVVAPYGRYIIIAFYLYVRLAYIS